MTKPDEDYGIPRRWITLFFVALTVAFIILAFVIGLKERRDAGLLALCALGSSAVLIISPWVPKPAKLKVSPTGEIEVNLAQQVQQANATAEEAKETASKATQQVSRRTQQPKSERNCLQSDPASSAGERNSRRSERNCLQSDPASSAGERNSRRSERNCLQSDPASSAGERNSRRSERNCLQSDPASSAGERNSRRSERNCH